MIICKQCNRQEQHLHLPGRRGIGSRRENKEQHVIEVSHACCHGSPLKQTCRKPRGNQSRSPTLRTKHVKQLFSLSVPVRGLLEGRRTAVRKMITAGVFFSPLCPVEACPRISKSCLPSGPGAFCSRPPHGHRLPGKYNSPENGRDVQP